MTDNAIGGEIHQLAKNLVHCTSLETLSLTRTCAFMFFLDFYLIVIVFMAGTGLDDTGAVELIPMLGKCPNLTTLDLNGNCGSMALISVAVCSLSLHLPFRKHAHCQVSRHSCQVCCIDQQCDALEPSTYAMEPCSHPSRMSICLIAYCRE